MRFVLGSDLHGFLPEVPHCNLLILAGDILPDINQEVFVETKLGPWLDRISAENIIATWGNHDWLPFYGWSSSTLRWHLLVDESTKINDLNFFGSPWSLPYKKYAWMAPEKTLEQFYDAIPDNTDILITHTPPFEILDRNFQGKHCGSMALRKRIELLHNLKLVVCGHIHESRGKDGLIVNASSVSGISSTGRSLIENPWTVVEIDL